jgi:hypothetical protein
MGGAYRLRDFPHELVRFACTKCERAGRYRKSNLIKRYGAAITLPDLRIEVRAGLKNLNRAISGVSA